MRRYIIILSLFLSFSTLVFSQKAPTYVQVKTNQGSFTILLYEDTPLHRESFLTHVRANDYDDIAFHRVVKNFMVQAGGNVRKGDEETKRRLAEKHKEKLPAEILYPKYFHKRGAVAAARTANEVNPEKQSDSFQFYVVVGQFYLDTDLEQMEQEHAITIPDSIKTIYMTQGGAPFLDGEYTVFGEVVKGMRTIEKIQNLPTDDQDSPTKEAFIKSMKIVSKP